VRTGSVRRIRSAGPLVASCRHASGRHRLAVTNRLTWTNDAQRELMGIGPRFKRGPGKLGSVVEHDRLRQADRCAEAVEHARHAQGGHGSIHLDRDALVVKSSRMFSMRNARPYASGSSVSPSTSVRRAAWGRAAGRARRGPDACLDPARDSVGFVCAERRRWRKSARRSGYVNVTNQLRAGQGCVEGATLTLGRERKRAGARRAAAAHRRRGIRDPTDVPTRIEWRESASFGACRSDARGLARPARLRSFGAPARHTHSRAISP
jgi:hypothetical protein